MEVHRLPGLNPPGRLDDLDITDRRFREFFSKALRKDRTCFDRDDLFEQALELFDPKTIMRPDVDRELLSLRRQVGLQKFFVHH